MMLDNPATDPLQIVADLRRQLDQRTAEVEALTAERDEAVAQHQKVVDEMWERALKGKEAARYLHELIAAVEAEDAGAPAETTPMR